MEWKETLFVSLSTLVVAKILDWVSAFFNSKRDFEKYRRQKVYEEIDDLRNEIGVLYETAARWNSAEEKQKDYLDFYIRQNKIIGKYNKYPKIGRITQTIIHKCSLVAYGERNHENVDKAKNEMHEAFKDFLEECNKELKTL